MDVSVGFWIAFNLFILVLLALDLGVFNRKAHIIGLKEAGLWSLLWISLALLFNLGLYFVAGPEKGLEFLTGYLIEYSLSVDNIFVFVMIFSSFAVPPKYQHRVLFWGIVGALLLRGSLILAGAALIHRFEWVLYLFGFFLLFAGLRMLRGGEEAIDLEHNRLLRFIRRIIPMSNDYDGSKFLTLREGRRLATPLLLVLIFVEFTDVMFALDSIPAIFAITQDPFIVYTSNVFAILGLRSLYFLLAGIVHKFIHLRYGLAVVLSFVGLKILLAGFFHIHIPNLLSLAIIAVTLSISILSSLLFAEKVKEKAETSIVEP